MTQIDVSLTDYGLAVECVYFTYLFARLRTTTSSLPLVFTAFFPSIALAAAAGGTVHGFFLDESSLGYRILWPFTLIVMGITALSGVHIGTALQFSPSKAVYINRAALVVFMAYVSVVLFIRRDFLIAILDYLPALIFIGGAFLLAHRRQKKSAFLIGFLGVCMMLFAAAAQQAKLGIHPRYFDHNALYHVLQAVALFMVFLAALTGNGQSDGASPSWLGRVRRGITAARPLEIPPAVYGCEWIGSSRDRSSTKVRCH